MYPASLSSLSSHSRLSLGHYRTAPELLSEAGRFSCLCSLSSLVVCTAAALWCAGQGGLRLEVGTVLNVQGRKVHLGGEWSGIRYFSFFKKRFYLM